MIGNTLEMMYTDEMVYPQINYGYYIKAVYEGEESMPTSTTTISLPMPLGMSNGVIGYLKCTLMKMT
ncbi:MAG: hypothetical protein R2750_04135 [Bacteroidales bacterium]